MSDDGEGVSGRMVVVVSALAVLTLFAAAFAVLALGVAN